MRTSIYLPDALAEQVKAYGISISEVTQDALRKAVRTAQLKETVMSDIQAVAERLRATISAADAEEHDQGYDDGVTWAKSEATRDELTYVAEGPGRARLSEVDMPTLLGFMSAKDNVNYASIRIDPDDPYWQGFIRGASEVWSAVQNLI